MTLPEFIEKTIAEVPEKEERLLNQLKVIKDSVGFAAPELYNGWEDLFTEALRRHFTRPNKANEDWELKIEEIYQFYRQTKNNQV